MGIGIDRIPLILPVAVTAPGGVVAQTPWPNIDPRAQVGVLTVAITAVAITRIGISAI
ncbi:hypothetical protein D3C78_1869820 [compost metagenome]